MRISYSLPVNRRTAFLLWIVWVTLSSLALSLGLAIGDAIVDAPLYMGIPSILILPALPAILLGIAQGFFLRSLLPSHRWTLLTILTWPFFFVPLISAIAILHDSGGADTPLLGIVIAGIISLFAMPMAIAQWILLRKHFCNAGFWILAVYAGAFLTVILLLHPYAYAHHINTQPFTVYAILGGLPASSTGLCLISLKPLQSKMPAGT